MKNNLVILVISLLVGKPVFSNDKVPLRVGYFANITHAQAIVGFQESRFQKALGDQVVITPFVFNAGPSAVEALFGGSVDIVYVGPNPAINAWSKSKGEVKIVSGSCSGGAALVVREKSGIKTAKDFAGKKLATPQLGNTQDVAARNWLISQGLKPADKGGTVQVLPIKNADQFSFFDRGEIDAVWAVEPWASKLVNEAHGKIFLDEKTLWPKGKFTTAVVLVSKKFLKEHPEIVEKFVAEHIEITSWLNTHPKEGKKIVNEGLLKLTGKALPAKVLDDSFASLEFTYDPVTSSIVQSAKSAFSLGFLGKEAPQLDGIVELGLLNKILVQKKLKPLD